MIVLGFYLAGDSPGEILSSGCSAERIIVFKIEISERGCIAFYPLVECEWYSYEKASSVGSIFYIYLSSLSKIARFSYSFASLGFTNFYSRCPSSYSIRFSSYSISSALLCFSIYYSSNQLS